MKKRLLACVLAGAMVVGTLTACGSTQSAEETTESGTTDVSEAGTSEADTAEAADDSLTLESGKLMVAAEIGYPPMEYYDEDGATPIGFDMELAAAIADEMGLELQIIDTAWDGIFAGLDADKYDVIMACVSYTDSRNEEYLLSKPYVANAPVLVVPNDSDIADVTDLSGKSVAVQMETTADYVMQDQISAGVDMDLRQYEKVINAFDEIKAGRVDAVCTDTVVANYYLGDESNNYKTVWQAPEAEPIVMCFKKGNDNLKDAMEAAVSTLKENGKLGEIATKYFGSDITADIDY